MSVAHNFNAFLHSISAGGVALIDRLVHYLARPGSDSRHVLAVALIALGAKMTKADGVTTVDEKQAFFALLDIPASERHNVERLFNLARRDVAGFEIYASQIGEIFRGKPERKSDILSGLFKIAGADGVIHEAELAFLARVNEIFGLGNAEFDALMERAIRTGSDPYRILGIEENAPVRKVRQRYHELARAAHPDRLAAADMTDSDRQSANDRMRRYNMAYSQIMRERAPRSRRMQGKAPFGAGDVTDSG